MKKPVIMVFLAILGGLAAGLVSCASMASAPRSDALSNNRAPDSVTPFQRPNTAPEKAMVKTLPLPVPHNARIEAARRLKDFAGRLTLVLQKGVRDRLAAHTRRLKEAVPVDTVRRPPSAVKKSVTAADRGRATVSPRPPVTDQPPVRPVVNTPAPDTSSGRNGTRTVFARLDDDVDIAFNESGWICLEIPPEGAGLEYRGRSLEGGKTLFKFRGRRIGEYGLPFQYQDNTRGVMKHETIGIKVLDQKEFDAALGPGQDEAARAERAKRRAYGLKLYELGNFPEALRELLASWSAGDPELNHLIASLALREKDYKNAVLYWMKNLDAKDLLREKSIAGLIRAHAAAGDRTAALGLSKELLAIAQTPIETELGILMGLTADLRDEALASDILNAYRLRYPAGSRLAQAYYLLGRLHEFTRTFRDFRKAREYYERVVREFPESEYFAPARERIAFVNRHYFKVQ